MRIIIAPSELNVDPVLGGDCAIVVVLGVMEQRRLADLPLVGREEQDVGT